MPGSDENNPPDKSSAATDSAEKDPRVYFAAERTFLAWIRTGLGLMGVGFAVSRFGLFLRQFTATEARTGAASGGLHATAHATTHSVWAGVGLVVLGVVVNVAATIRHYQIVHALRAGRWQPGHVSRTAVALALVLAALGLLMAVYLVFVR
jgi:putative membrane protein